MNQAERNTVGLSQVEDGLGVPREKLMGIGNLVRSPDRGIHLNSV